MKRGKFSYEKKIFLGFFLVSIISLIIVSGGAYGIYREAMKDRLDITMDAIAAQVAYKTDTVINNVRKYYTEIASSGEILELRKKDGEDAFYKELSASIKLLKGPGYLSEFIIGYSFINRQKEWILSNRGLYSWEELENKEEVEAIFKQLKAIGMGSSIWLNKEEKNARSSRQTVALNGISLGIKVPFITDQPECAMIVNLDFYALSQLIQDGIGDYGITVLDQNGCVVFGSKEMVTDYCKTNYNEISSCTEAFSIQIEENGEKKELRISQKHSESSGWNYLVSFDMDPVMEGGDGILLLGVITASSIGIALTLAMIGSKRIYHPVEVLVDQAKRIRSTHGTLENELDYISTAMTELARERTNLYDTIKGQRKELKNLFFQKLISGTFQKEEIEKRQQELGIYIDKKVMLMATAVRMNKQEMDVDVGKDAILICAMEYIKSMGESILVCDPIWSGNLIVSIFHGDSNEVIQDTLMAMHQKMGEMIQKRYLCTVYSGVSNGVVDVKELSVAYYECLEAIRNNEVLKKGIKWTAI